MARTTNFSELNFDCVLVIFKYLKSLEDQVNFARCCLLFREVFIYFNRYGFEEIVDSDIKLKSFAEWGAFLSMCGENVKSLQLYYDDEHPLKLLPLVSKYCTNLENITLHNLTVARSQQFLIKMTSLKKVYVRNYKSTSKNLIKSMRCLPNIRSLGLDCFDRRELQELRYFTNLEELQLSDDITESEFVAIFKSMKNLRILQLRNAKGFLTTYTLKQLATRCRQLEKLSFFDSEAKLSVIGQFTNLKYLQFSCPDQMKTQLFKALAAKCSTNLQFLILHRKRWINEEQARYIGALRALKLLVCKPRDDRCIKHLSQLTQLQWLSLQCARQISEMPLICVLRNNYKLQYVNICYCMGITDEFVIDALDILARRWYSDRQQLEIYAAATDIRRDIMDRLSASDYTVNHIRMYFECSKGIQCDEHFYYDDPEFDR